LPHALVGFLLIIKSVIFIRILILSYIAAKIFSVLVSFCLFMVISILMSSVKFTDLFCCKFFITFILRMSSPLLNCEMFTSVNDQWFCFSWGRFLCISFWCCKRKCLAMSLLPSGLSPCWASAFLWLELSMWSLAGAWGWPRPQDITCTRGPFHQLWESAFEKENKEQRSRIQWTDNQAHLPPSGGLSRGKSRHCNKTRTIQERWLRWACVWKIIPSMLGSTESPAGWVSAPHNWAFVSHQCGKAWRGH
jgi:hypothetical protein